MEKYKEVWKSLRKEIERENQRIELKEIGNKVEALNG